MSFNDSNNNNNKLTSINKTNNAKHTSNFVRERENSKTFRVSSSGDYFVEWIEKK